jgi:hypothetical protein
MSKEGKGKNQNTQAQSKITFNSSKKEEKYCTQPLKYKYI